MKRRGFTLIEMLVVIGIIAMLMGVLLASVSTFLKTAEKARCQELVANTATA
nr:type II secretion system GspH family protein [Kiritimatiellia bacterium]